MAYSKIFRVRLVALSPIHIGCDDAYDPTTFRIDEKNKKLIHFKLQDFIKSLKEEELRIFSELCSKGTVKSLIEIFKFIGATQVQGNGNSVELCSGFLEHYKKLKELAESKIEKEMKQFVINRTAYNPNSQQPYIPGSSLKGSLRTAYLNLLARETRSAQLPIKKSKDLEERLLGGSFFSDPLRFLHISDLQPKEVSHKIVYAVNKKKEVSEPQGPFQILETIQPGSEFEGTMEIIHPFEKSEDSLKFKEVNLFDQKKLFKADNFYIRLFSEEEKISQEIGVNLKLVKGFIKQAKDQSEKGESLHLIRIGRHSGAEAVTIEGYRSIKIMQKKEAKCAEPSTTVWLASNNQKPNSTANLLPFGWALLKFSPLN